MYAVVVGLTTSVVAVDWVVGRGEGWELTEQQRNNVGRVRRHYLQLTSKQSTMYDKQNYYPLQTIVEVYSLSLSLPSTSPPLSLSVSLSPPFTHLHVLTTATFKVALTLKQLSNPLTVV